MACAVPEEVSERLTCAICMEQFKEPKALPCLHTYCKECLVKLVKKQGSDHVITCPDCRLDTKVPDGDVGKLQPNFWVNNFMTLLRIQDSTREQGTGKPLICERCYSGDSAVSRCTNCRVFMCEFCVTAHKRINAFKHHQILSLTEVENLGSKAPVKPAFCIKHPDETLKLFCDTCQKAICPDCTIIDHFEHKYDFVADVAERERKVVQAVLQETKAKDIAIEAGLKAVQAMESCVEAKITEVSKDVDVFFDAQVKALEYLRANLKYDVTTQGQMKLKELGNQKEMLALSLAQLRSSVEFAERVLVDGDDMELLSTCMKQQLIQKLTQLNAPQFQCKPCNSDHLKLQVDKTIWDIGTMATLCYTPVNTTKYVLNMVGGQEGVVNQTFAGQPVRFVLSIKDGTAVNKSATGFVVHASVNHSRKPNLYEILPVHDNGDGSYLFCYRPVVDGLCTLTVTVGGENVLGSPFTWIVKPEQPEAKMTHEQSLLTSSSEQHKQLSAGQRPFFTPPQMQQVRPRWQPQQQMRPSEVQGIPGGGQVPRAKGMRQVAPRGMPRQQQQQPGGGGGMGWTQQVRGPEARQGQGERKRPAFKFQQNVRNQPQAHPGAVSMQAQAIDIPGQDPLYPSVLAAASPPDQKQILGERLFPLIQNMQPDQAAKITGMLLELDNRELLHMLESREALIAKIQEAVSVLRVHSAKEKRVEIKN